MTKIPFVDFPKDTEMDSPPPDGKYAVITHDPGYGGFGGRNPLVLNPFPWRTTIHEFKGGASDERAVGSNAGDMLSRYTVEKVFLIGLDPAERAELDRTLTRFQIELVPEEKVAA